MFSRTREIPSSNLGGGILRVEIPSFLLSFLYRKILILLIHSIIMIFEFRKSMIFGGVFLVFLGITIFFSPPFYITGYVVSETSFINPFSLFLGGLFIFLGIFMIMIGTYKKTKTIKEIIDESVEESS